MPPKTTLARSMAEAGYGAEQLRKVVGENARKVMVVTALGEVLGVSHINMRICVGGKATSRTQGDAPGGVSLSRAREIGE